MTKPTITIEVDLDSIKYALEVITKTSPPTSGNVVFQCQKGVVSVTSVADLSRCSVKMVCTLMGEGEFAIPIQSIKDAIAGRPTLKLEYTDGTLHVSSGRYKTSLSTVDVIPMDAVMLEKDSESWTLDPEQALWLKDALKKVVLKPTSMFSTWMPAGIQITKTGAFVACYDDQHLSWLRDKKITGDFSCLLPIDVLQSVMDVFHQTKFRLEKSRAFIRVQNKQISLVLNTPMTDDIRPLAEIIEKVKMAKGAESIQFGVKKKVITDYLANARSVIGKERAELHFEPKADKSALMGVSVKTVQGNCTAMLKYTGKVRSEFKVDHDYFAELVSKCTDDVEVSVVEGAFLSIKTKETTALVALNQ